MKLLQEYVKSVVTLNEGFDDIISVIIRIRVKIQGPESRTLRDVQTDIRGLINVITVEQQGKISEFNIDGKSYVTLIVKFEDDENYHVRNLLKDIRSIQDVDFLRFIRVDDPRG